MTHAGAGRRRVGVLALALGVLAAVAAGCGGSDGASDSSTSASAAVDVPAFVTAVRPAMAAVEARLGAGQEFFEITANEQFVNVFVAVDGGTAAVPYLYLDGELQPPAPRQDGASGFTFTAADVSFDEARLLSGVSTELPETEIDALSVYGDGTRAIYVLNGSSDVGGFLDIQVGPQGRIIGVDPV